MAFSYYGSKSKIAKYYPDPVHDLVIEPFAGAGWYSFTKKPKQVWLNDLDQNVASVWRFLIDEADEQVLRENQDLRLGFDIRDLQISEGHRNLLGFLINRGSAMPANLVQKWSCQSKKTPQKASTVMHSIQRIVENLQVIKAFNFTSFDYQSLPNIEATWFIDPPYQNGGHRYSCKVDFDELKKWVNSRKGQVIVCENSSATWIQGNELVTTHGQKRKTKEIVAHWGCDDA